MKWMITNESLVPETPHEHSLDHAPLRGTMLADIVRSEIRPGLVPLHTQVANLNTHVCGCLETVEGQLKEHDVKIMKFEQLVLDRGSNSSTPKSNQSLDRIEQHEEELAHLKLQFEALNMSYTQRETDVTNTVVVGGQGLAFLHEATPWLTDKLCEMSGPVHQGTYMKSTKFYVFFGAKFRTSYDRDIAVALLRSRNMTTSDGKMWATQDLPIPVRAWKLFLLGLRWQLGQRGFVNKEISLDDA